MFNMYNHYIRVEDGKIIKGFSDAFEASEQGDIIIAENTEARHFMIGDTVNPQLIQEQGISLYKYEDGQILQRTELEIQTDIDNLPPLPKTQLEILTDAVDIIILDLLS